uniref:Uncharacterized protein n=1 Tax=Arundo donax TaxID=35708 RepID=A0A0A9FM08_ARUDO
MVRKLVFCFKQSSKILYSSMDSNVKSKGHHFSNNRKLDPEHFKQ